MRKIKEIMLRFLSFGSGSSGNCYLLYTDTDCLMIDCGVGIRSLKKSFHNYGLQMKMVHNILITHDHADHVKSVGSISGDLQLPVYTTSDVHLGISKNWCVRRKIDHELTRELIKDQEVQIGEFYVTPFSVPHDSTDCVGYSIRHDDLYFTLVTDCGHITDDIAHYISISNYLVIEANHEPEKLSSGPYPRHLKERISGLNGHLSNEACANALANNATPNLHHVWLCHLSDENNHPELAKKTIESMLRNRGIIAGKDFLLDVLKRKTPSEVFNLV